MLLAALLTAAACSDDGGQANGNGAAGVAAANGGSGGSGTGTGTSGGGAAGSGGPASGTLSFATDVYEAVIKKRCSACHTDATSFGSLQFFPGGAEMAYAKLVDAPAGSAMGNLCKDSGLTRVKPGDPDHSLIYLKLTKPPCGSQMPPAAFAQATPEQVEVVRKWIADGAAP